MADVAEPPTLSLKAMKSKSANVSSAKAAKSAKSAKIPKVNSRQAKNHPTYAIMVSEAITALNDRKGASNMAIKNQIVSKYNLDANTARPKISVALKKGVSNGSLVQVTGTGAGRFRNAPKAPNASKTVVRKTAVPNTITPKPAKKATSITKSATASSKTVTKSRKSTKSKSAKSKSQKNKSTKSKPESNKKSTKKAPTKRSVKPKKA